MQACQFHPTHTFGEICGKPASRQVFFPPEVGGSGYYLYICDDCLSGAIDYWQEGGFNVEF